MNVLLFLIPLALLMGAGFAALFAWSVQSGQFDDLDDPAVRMLEPDGRPPDLNECSSDPVQMIRQLAASE